MHIRRLGYALGAEITGVDLRRPASDETLAAIRAAWLEHIVLCLPGQDLEPEELMAFAGRFGTLDDLRLAPHTRHPQHDTVMILTNKQITLERTRFEGNVANTWHTDLSYTDRPTTASFLVAKELPEVGGNTMWANMYLAYETLSPGMRRLIDGLEGVHDVSISTMFARNSPEVQAQRLAISPPTVHPVARTHPETGRKALYLGDRVRTFVGMTEEESRPLVAFLNRHATRYEFVYRHAWHAGDLVMWDNRCALHYAVPDHDPGAFRRMIRCSLVPAPTGYQLARL